MEEAYSFCLNIRLQKEKPYFNVNLLLAFLMLGNFKMIMTNEEVQESVSLQMQGVDYKVIFQESTGSANEVGRI